MRRSFIMLSRSGCPYCENLEQKLKDLKDREILYYNVLKISQLSDRKKIYENLGLTDSHATMPQLFLVRRIPGEVIETIHRFRRISEFSEQEAVQFFTYSTWMDDLSHIKGDSVQASAFLDNLAG